MRFLWQNHLEGTLIPIQHINFLDKNDQCRDYLVQGCGRHVDSVSRPPQFVTLSIPKLNATILDTFFFAYINLIGHEGRA
jgi:hypothetical protein